MRRDRRAALGVAEVDAGHVRPERAAALLAEGGEHRLEVEPGVERAGGAGERGAVLGAGRSRLRISSTARPAEAWLASV